MDPVTLGMLAMGAGKLFGLFGHRREANAVNQTNRAEDLRLDAEQRRRAEARAALMRGIMDSSGFGGTMTDDQMVNMFVGTNRRGTVPVPSVWSGLGDAATGVGQSLVMGSADAAPKPGSHERSAEWWEEFVDSVLHGRNGAGSGNLGGTMPGDRRS